VSGNRPVPLRLSGSAYDRGRAHGEALRRPIAEVVSRWIAELETYYAIPAREIIARFFERTDFLPAIECWTPHLLDEVRGIADGCGVDFETMLAFQCVDEIWANGDRIAGEHCSTFGFRGDAGRPAILAQTIDVESFRDGAQALLLIEEECLGGTCLVATCAGVLGFNGLNRRGLGVCCNAELQLRHRQTGLPVAFVLRGVLEQKSVDAAAAFLREIPHATGQHYLLADPTQMRSLECSAGAVAEWAPDDGKAIWHTNHPLASDDLHAWYRAMLEAGESYPFLANSRVRLATLERKLRTAGAACRPEQLRRILASADDPRHPICSCGDEGEFYAEMGLFTFGATLMVLSDPPELHATLGPPRQTAWQVVGFDGESTSLGDADLRS